MNFLLSFTLYIMDLSHINDKLSNLMKKGTKVNLKKLLINYKNLIYLNQMFIKIKKIKI